MANTEQFPVVERSRLWMSVKESREPLKRSEENQLRQGDRASRRAPFSEEQDPLDDCARNANTTVEPPRISNIDRGKENPMWADAGLSTEQLIPQRLRNEELEDNVSDLSSILIMIRCKHGLAYQTENETSIEGEDTDPFQLQIQQVNEVIQERKRTFKSLEEEFNITRRKLIKAKQRLHVQKIWGI